MKLFERKSFYTTLKRYGVEKILMQSENILYDAKQKNMLPSSKLSRVSWQSSRSYWISYIFHYIKIYWIINGWRVLRSSDCFFIKMHKWKSNIFKCIWSFIMAFIRVYFHFYSFYLTGGRYHCSGSQTLFRNLAHIYFVKNLSTH